jgi:hypothetical protein
MSEVISWGEVRDGGAWTAGGGVSAGIDGRDGRPGSGEGMNGEGDGAPAAGSGAEKGDGRAAPGAGIPGEEGVRPGSGTPGGVPPRAAGVASGTGAPTGGADSAGGGGGMIAPRGSGRAAAERAWCGASKAFEATRGFTPEGRRLAAAGSATRAAATRAPASPAGIPARAAAAAGIGVEVGVAPAGVAPVIRNAVSPGAPPSAATAVM